MSDNFTADQRRAVEADGGNVLVSASAGSGKTFVMIQRLIRLVVEGKAKVSEILAVTFTEAAAAEMKQKLVAALRKKLVSGADNSKIREALGEVPTASISTVHKFCADILRCYCYEIGLDPAFKVADETISDDLRNRAIDKTFAKAYDAGDEDFLYLVRVFRSSRSDGALKENVKNLVTFASSEKDPDEFIANCGKEPTESEFLKIEEEIADYYRKKAENLLSMFLSLGETLVNLGVKNADKYFGEVSAKLRSIISARTLREAIVAASVSVSRAPSVPKEYEKEKELFDELKTKLKKLCDDCSAAFVSDEESAKRDFLSTKRTVQAFSKLALLYKEEYAALKNEESLVDFSDLEHLAYKLLKTSPDALKSIQKRYKYAFCDEYQDVNAVQEAILSLVSPDNLFMVGDVKQCIYAFRGCNPDIFAEKFALCDNGGGEAISLSENFRSTEGVLNAVNNVFSATMTDKTTKIDYASRPMIFGKLYPEHTGKAVMHVIVGEKDKKESPEGLYDIVADATAKAEPDSFYEGLLVGDIIYKELKTGRIYDLKTGEERDVKPKDIAVLLRNSKGFATEIVKTLTRMSVPVSSAAKNSITGYPEIKLLTDVLKLIDFYADDAPLISVLKSPVGKLTEEELAAIRNEAPARTPTGQNEKKSKPATFSKCVEFYLENGKDAETVRKLKAFDEYFKKIRLLSEFTGAGEILVKIIKDSSLDLEILTTDLGEIRLERINRFISESEKDGEKLSVREFLKKIENAGGDISLSESGGSDSVTVMSMHASKGLEFPVVIIAGLGRQFNAQDEREELLLSKTRGLAPYAYDEETMEKRPTLKREIVKRESRQNCAREELRLLYVAMTRAESRLHMVTSEDLPLSRNADTALEARKFIDFLSPYDMETEIHEKSEIVFAGGADEHRHITVGEPNEELTKRILKNLEFKYAYEKDTLLPVKRSVTDILKETETEESTSGFEQVLNSEKTDGKNYDPDKKRLKGIAYHRFLECWDFKEKSADKELIRQLSRGDLEREQAELLDKNSLQRVMNLKIFDNLEGYTIYREKPFVAKFSASETGYGDANGEMLVQGVIDLLAIRGDEATIIDYKDSSKKGAALAEYYRPQLTLYKKAVEKVLGLHVKKTVVLSLKTGEAYEI